MNASPRRLGILVVAVLLLTSTIGACVGPAPTFSVATVVGGLHRPWDFGFTPGGGMVITERPGAIRFRATTGELRTLTTPSDVVAQGEGGMLGVAIDPSFPDNRRIYTCFVSNLSGSLDVRVVRWRMNAAATALTDRADIVTGLPANPSGRHSGCRPRFGPDGRLWIGTGDAAMPTVPQDPTSLGGKVLRVDTNGAGVPGNATAPFDPRIYTYGHRNVQGIAFSPGGKAYSIEHGTGRDDEVNLLVARANYGWDPRPTSGPLFYDESRPMTDTVRHPGARAAIWSSGNPTIAPSGGVFVSGSPWKGWNRGLAMAVLKDQHLHVIRFDADGTAVLKEWEVITDRGRLRSAVFRPSNGALYIVTDADPGSILRVLPAS
jgi:glucose/arabinose dehydrogenase